VHWMTIYMWLETNNLWKATVTWFVGIILGALVLQRPWRQHRRTQKQIAHLLDTDTEGGLNTVISEISELRCEVERLARRDDHEEIR
jgi:hypothetical protein